jgi:putative hydrolase of the HAD superfamily
LFDHRHACRTALSALQSAHACLSGWTLDALERAHAEVLEDLHREVLKGALGLDEARAERFSRLFRQAGDPLEGERVVAVAAYYREAYQAARRPVAGALDLLRTLKPQARIGIVTNNLASEQRDKLAHCGLGVFVDALVVSDEAGAMKPDPAIFRLALEQLEAEPGETVMVGDSWALDVLGAKAAGLHAVWFNRLGRPQPDPGLAPEIRTFEPAADAVRVILGPGTSSG